MAYKEEIGFVELLKNVTNSGKLEWVININIYDQFETKLEDGTRIVLTKTTSLHKTEYRLDVGNSSGCTEIESDSIKYRNDEFEWRLFSRLSELYIAISKYLEPTDEEKAIFLTGLSNRLKQM